MPTTLTVIGVPTGPRFGEIVTVRSIEEAALGDLDAVHDGVDVVDSAEVLRGLDGHAEGAGRVRLRRGEHDADLVDLAAEVVDAVGLRVEDVADVGGHPDERDVLARRQARTGERDARARDGTSGVVFSVFMFSAGLPGSVIAPGHGRRAGDDWRRNDRRVGGGHRLQHEHRRGRGHASVTARLRELVRASCCESFSLPSHCVTAASWRRSG